MALTGRTPLASLIGDYGQAGKRSPIRGVEIGALLGNKYDALVDLLPDHKSPAICEPSNPEKAPLTHWRLRSFVKEEFDLTSFGIAAGQRVAVLLPNGPELAVTIISVVSRWCAAPINPTNTWQEIKAELVSTRAVAVLVLSGASVNEAAMKAASELGIGVIALSPLGNVTGLFSLSSLQPINMANVPPPPPAHTYPAGFVTYHHPETVLLLHTSGTSGNKKLVPYSLDMIIVGVGCIVASWNLQPSDVCLNMMPLFHIGGIVRNIFSPILSGGAVMTCSGFDPLLFWDILYNTVESSRLPRVTWYYAAPTMHHAILSEAERRPKPLPVDSIRYIANAAGGLLPVLAASLRDTFQATILTSYGMTECMPISTPPQDYALDPSGTSGTPVGPDILIVDDNLKALSTGEKGNIFVRGPPCFGGYENNGAANEESFFAVAGHGAGWFNTGDCGSMDSRGYLFITGRSKEIINRGGETISPFEIEEAIVQHPYVKESIAFSAPHDQYQETVGAIIVTRPNKPRVDLPSLHSYLESRLHRSKWPMVLVYCDALPKNAAGKTLRIKFAERIGLKVVDEESSPLSRIFEAKCPPIGTALTVPIPISPVTVSYEDTLLFLKKQDEVNDVGVVLLDLPNRVDALVACVVLNSAKAGKLGTLQTQTLLKGIINKCAENLDQYLVPCELYDVPAIPVTTNTDGRIVTNTAELKAMASALYEARNVIPPRNQTEKQVELLWRAMLGSPTMISVTSSFFDLGGDSLKAGQIIGAMRSELRVPLTVADLFTAPTIAAIAAKISTLKTLGSPQLASNKIKSPIETLARNEKRRLTAGKFQTTLASIEEEKRERLNREYMTWDFTPPYLNTSFYCLLVQALPIAVIYPMRRIVIWFLIAAPWVYLMKQGFGRFHALLAAMFAARVAIGLGAPLLGIAAKWLIIGRYTAGRYPLWGAMYLKWWLVEQIVNIMGKGFFRDDLPVIGVYMVRLYYILMGANIGANVKIHKDAKLGQADLLSIGDNVAIDNCTIRPFAIEEGHFVLLPVEIGKNSSVGVKSVVAGGAIVPRDTAIGPLSSSHELDDAESEYRKYCRPTFSPPPSYLIIFVGIPLMLLVLAVSFIPWFLVLKVMVNDAKTNGWYKGDLHSIYHAFLWWITPQRLFYFFLLRIVKRCVVPFIKLGAVIMIKWLVLGKFTEMDEEEKARPWNRFRYWFMAKMLPGGGLAGVAKLVGTHYEIISMVYRLLGAKIGQRVYWPGSGLELVEFDLLEVGSDVVFGSRSVILTSSASASKKVVLEDGVMVADRCVILPGARVCRGAVLGSGALAGEDMEIPVGSVWVGSKEGKALIVSPPDNTYKTCSTLSPFGKAFYNQQADYTVIPLWAIVLYNTAWQAFCTCYRNCPTVLSLILCSQLMPFDPFDDKGPLELFRLTLISFTPLYLLLCVVALCVDIGGKWLLLGRREKGVYAWDESSYCQRWQMYLTLQEIRRGERHKTGILDMIQGSAYLVWYFRLLGAKIGNNVCLYPNGGDPMMTEPDLVTIGDFANIDDASLIAHINTRGMFRLNPLVVGTGSVLKSMSRLLSGASMQAHSVLQEHTLVLAGEEVEAGQVWQGWPCRRQEDLKEYRGRVQELLDRESLRIVRENQSNPPSAMKGGYGAVQSGEEDEVGRLGEDIEGRQGGRGRGRANSAGPEGERMPLLGRR